MTGLKSLTVGQVMRMFTGVGASLVIVWSASGHIVKSYADERFKAMLVEQGYLDADFAEHREDHEADIVDALYHALKGSPCKLLAASITDAVGEKRAQNQPGTNNEYPNWRIPLADAKGNVVPLETLFDTPGAQRFAQIFNS